MVVAKPRAPRSFAPRVALVALLTVWWARGLASAQSPLGDLAKKAQGAVKEEATKTVKKEVRKDLLKKVNSRLLAEGKKSQCAFKTNSDELMPGCDGKMKKLAGVLVDVKKVLNDADVDNFTFVVSGHTDTTGSAARNKELSQKRADVVVRELVAKGVPRGEIKAIGMGADRPLVKPDDTEAKRKKNRRYEIQVEI